MVVSVLPSSTAILTLFLIREPRAPPPLQRCTPHDPTWRHMFTDKHAQWITLQRALDAAVEGVWIVYTVCFMHPGVQHNLGRALQRYESRVVTRARHSVP
jgi:hypothetical protein